MTTGQIIFGIFLFAVVTAILYVWGLRRSVTQTADLERILLSKCAARVVKYLKHNPTITQKEIAHQIESVKAGLFWSRNHVEVQNSSTFAKKLIRYMLDQHLLEQVGNACYRRKS